MIAVQPRRKKGGFESQIHPLLDEFWTIHPAFSHLVPLVKK